MGRLPLSHGLFLHGDQITSSVIENIKFSWLNFKIGESHKNLEAWILLKYQKIWLFKPTEYQLSDDETWEYFIFLQLFEHWQRMQPSKTG